MSPLPEAAFALARNPAVAVGLPVALSFATSYITSQRRAQRTGLPQEAVSQTTTITNYIWTAMYGLAGYAAHLTVRAFDAAPTPQTTEDASNALQLYYAQLALGLLWEPIAGENKPKAALVDALAVLGIAGTMAVKMNDLITAPINTSWFLAPYVSWLAYSTFLNAQTVYQQEK